MAIILNGTTGVDVPKQLEIIEPIGNKLDLYGYHNLSGSEIDFYANTSASPQGWIWCYDGGVGWGASVGPAEIWAGNSPKLYVYANGDVLVVNTGSLGYGTGNGGSVTQLTSRTTGVTINNSCGQITMFSAAGSTTAASFTVTNSKVAATDSIILSQASGTNLYDLMVTAVSAGSFRITFRTTSGTATDAPVINFAIIKGTA